MPFGHLLSDFVENDNPAFATLSDGLRRALDAYFEQKASPRPKPASRRRRGLAWDIPGAELGAVLRDHFPDLLAVAAEAAKANGRDEPWMEQCRSDTAGPVQSELLELIKLAGDQPDTVGIALRAADLLAGRPLALWEYITVDLTVPVTSVPLFGGWELCGIDRMRDPALPVEYLGFCGELWSAEALHSVGFGALRRAATAQTLDAVSDDDRDLLWPLIALNLYSDVPVRGFTAYQVEPGRSVVGRRNGPWYLPVELKAWHGKPLTLLPRRPQPLDGSKAAGLSRYGAEIGSWFGALGSADRDQFARAADHYLYLVYHHGYWDTELDSGYVAFRRTVAIEALLRGADSDHQSIGRKVEQRAAVLLGSDDDTRLAARDLIRAAYAARSTFAHGSGKTKPVDHTALAHATQVIMRRWLALAAVCAGRRVAALLDDALLSTAVRDNLLDTLAERERRAGIA